MCWLPIEGCAPPSHTAYHNATKRTRKTLNAPIPGPSFLHTRIFFAPLAVLPDNRASHPTVPLAAPADSLRRNVTRNVGGAGQAQIIGISPYGWTHSSKATLENSSTGQCPNVGTNGHSMTRKYIISIWRPI
jgi:hypothetical protein